MELIRPDLNLDYVGKRRYAFVLSGLLLLLTVASLLWHGGPKYGIDFAGGILVQVRFSAPTQATEIKKALQPLGMEDALVQSFGSEEKHEFLIRSDKQSQDLQAVNEGIQKALVNVFGQDKLEIRRVETVGPKVGKDLREKALLALFFSILLMAVYISGRFEGKWWLAVLMGGVLTGATVFVEMVMTAWLKHEGLGLITLIITALVVTLLACWFLRLRYALGAVVALIHDAVVTIGVFSLLDREFSLAFVAALLTIIGYSVNDTIIIFDRIRENIKKGTKLTTAELINASVNQTMSRTILTSGLTMLVVISLFVLGGGVIEDFALAMIVGMISGTYSTVYIASAVLLYVPESGGGFARLSSAKATARMTTRPVSRPLPRKVEAEAQAASLKPRTMQTSGGSGKASGKKKKKR